jgi:hypothetical protein
MAAAIDPYYKWLGIPPAEQPANFYRLLGITVFETDPEVIESAAEQRMSHLRTIQSGPFSSQSQALLNEVAAAKVCLLKPERKLDYDNALRARLAIQVHPQPVGGPAVNPFPAPAFNLARNVAPPPAITCPRGPTCGLVSGAPSPVNVGRDVNGAADVVELETLGIAPPLSCHVHKEPKLPPIAWIAGPISLCVIVVLGVALVIEARKDLDDHSRVSRNMTPTESLRGDQPGQRTANSAASQPKQRQDKSATGSPEGGDGAATTSSQRFGESQVPLAGDVAGASNNPLLAGPMADKPADHPPSAVQPEPDAAPPPKTESAAPVAPAEAAAPPANTSNEVSPRPSADARRPIPDEAAQQVALRELRDVMSDELAAAKTAVSQQALARKLDELAADTPNDPALRYVLMSQALDYAIRGCDVGLANDLVRRLTQRYQVDTWELRERTWTRLSQTAPSSDLRAVLVKDAMQLADEAIRDDRYDLAVELAASAASLSTLLKDKPIRDQARDAAERAKRMQIAAVAAQAAFDRLLMTPDDAEANLIVGRFRCFDKQDWETGLPFLLRGADDGLRELARQEMRQPSSAVDQLKLADAWWDLAERKNEKHEGPSHEPLRTRAVHWYREAAPGLTGLALLKAQKRMAPLEVKPADAGNSVPGSHGEPKRALASGLGKT